MKPGPQLAWKLLLLVLFLCQVCSWAAEIQWVDAAVIEKGKKALVAVTTNRTDEATLNGFFASDTGHVITIAGPLDGAKSITVHTATGEKIKAELLAYDASLDIAVLVAGRKTPDYLKLSPSPPSVGAPCAVVFFGDYLKSIVSADGQFLARRQSLDASYTKFRPVWSVAFSPTLAGGTGSALLCADGTVGGLVLGKQVSSGKIPQTVFLVTPETDVASFLRSSIDAGTLVGVPQPGSINPDVFAMIDPDVQLANICTAKGDMLNAIHGYEKALQRHPRSHNILGNLAFCLIQAGDHKKARATLEKAVKEEPNDLQLRFYLASLPGEENLDSIKQLTIDAPLFTMAWGQLSVHFLDTGRTDEALEVLQKCTELEPDSMQAWEGYADALLKSGKLAESRVARARVAQLDSLYFKLRYTAPTRN